MTKFGIMQGRLVPPEPGRFQSFPRSEWQSEFAKAALVPFDYIEWIWDVYGHDVNPINSDPGISSLKNLVNLTGVGLRSICADFFMDRPFVRCTQSEREERLEQLRILLRRASTLGVNRIIVPFVDASAITSGEDLRTVTTVMTEALSSAEVTGVELHLETSLGPKDFKDLLDQLPHPMLKVNYDSGNSASLGYCVTEEFAAYGDRIGSVHIKDRVRGGSTVPLGTGSTDFPGLFDCLKKLKYTGDFTLQVARGAPGDEISWAKQNLIFLRDHWLS